MRQQTGGLKPGRGVTQAELNHLRAAVVGSLQSGQSESDIGGALVDVFASAADTLAEFQDEQADLEYLATQAGTGGANTRIARRTTPLRAAFDAQAQPAWSIGQEPARTFGPFVDADGKPAWFDLFDLLPQRVSVQRAGLPFVLLPPGTTRLRNALRLTIPASTVWILANQLTSGPPNNAWVGIRISGGTIGFPRGATFANDTLNVPVAGSVGLQVTLDPPTQAGPPTGAGAEATATDAQLPATASFVFGPLGVERIETDQAALTVYGQALTLASTGGGAHYDSTLRMVLVPLSPEPGSMTIQATQSDLYQPSGTAEIASAAWGLSITTTDPAALGSADGAGFLVLETRPGLRARWRGIAGEPAPLDTTWLAANTTQLMVLSPSAMHYRGAMEVGLWTDATLEASFAKPQVVWFISQRNGRDALGLGTSLVGHLDRPLLASGDRVPVRLDGSLILLQDDTQTTFAVEAIDQIAPWPPLAMALSNALLTVRPPHRLFANGTLGDGLQATSGSLQLELALYQVLPTLPDPYAANFEWRRERDAPVAGSTVSARVTWATPAAPQLDITLNAPAAAMLDVVPQARREFLDPLLGGQRGGGAYFWMLDVSSAADQLGVSLSMPLQPDGQASLSIKDGALQAPAQRTQALLLPQFQWEPVHNMPNPRSGDVDGYLHSEQDGGPAFVAAQSVNLVPVAPVPVATELVRAYQQDGVAALSKFTLPFGIVARANLDPASYARRPGLDLLAASFDGLTGERQLSITQGRRLPHGPIAQYLFEPLLAGTAVQTDNFPGAQQWSSTLGPSFLRDSFNNAFVAEIPITRIDLSGYGASLFSRWLLPGDPDVGITQVSFDAVHGRTSFERIQMVSYLWPCLARMIRTIVLERQGSGMVRRWDSGWLATTPGRFRLPGKFERTHAGVVDGMYDIREITDTSSTLMVGGAEVEAVYYDADVAFVKAGINPPVVSGQNASGRVPVRRQLGYVQLVPPLPGGGPAPLMTPAQFDQLLTMTGPIGGPIDAVIRIGSSEQQMRVTSLDTARVNPVGPLPSFAVSVHGSPIIVSASRWSMVRVAADSTVQPVDAARGVPLVRADGGSFRWADPSDLLHENNPASDYALLLSHDTQRLLFPRPKIDVGASNLTSTVSPRLADPYRMLQSTGLFPPLGQALDLAQTVELTPSALRLSTGTLDFAIPNNVRKIIDRSAWDDAIDYAGAQLHIDSARNWHVDLNGLQQVMSFDDGGEIFRIVHNAITESGLPSAFSTPDVRFPPALEAVTDVLDMLSQIVPGAMRDGDGPLHLDCSIDGTTFHLSAVADFDIADADGNAIDCGMGKVKGHLKVGGELSAELLKHEVHGAVFLEITGSWQQLIFPEIYGGGLLRVAVRGDEDGHTTFDLDACTVGSVGGDVVPGLIELEATVKYGYFIRFQDGTFHPGIVLGMEGRAKLLSGLLGFKLTVEGRLLVTPVFDLGNPDRTHVHLHGDILVAGTVTVAWIVDERKSFSTDFDTDVNWKTALLVAKAGLLPVP